MFNGIQHQSDSLHHGCESRGMWAVRGHTSCLLNSMEIRLLFCSTCLMSARATASATARICACCSAVTGCAMTHMRSSSCGRLDNDDMPRGHSTLSPSRAVRRLRDRGLLYSRGADALRSLVVSEAAALGVPGTEADSAG